MVTKKTFSQRKTKHYKTQCNNIISGSSQIQYNNGVHLDTQIYQNMQEKYTIESKIFLFFLLVVRWNVYLICTHNWFNEHFTYFSQIQIIFFKKSSKKLNLTLHRCCITGTLKLCKYMSLTIHKALLLFSNFHQFICHKC